MKLPLLGGAACLVALSACAAVTERTGITAEQQACVAQTLVAMESDAAAKDLRLAQKAALVAAACDVSIDAIVLQYAG